MLPHPVSSAKHTPPAQLVTALACARPGCECAKATHAGHGATHCPAHDDQNPSLSVSDGNGKVLFHCQAGCPQGQIIAALRDRGLWSPSASSQKPRAKIVATYDYRGVDGQLVYQVLRFDPKSFRQRRPDGNGSWIWNLKGVDRLPYRLPELTAAPPEAPVFVLEGEKDVNLAVSRGLVATCNSGGAGKWPTSAAAVFAGRRVVIIPDQDEPGRAHAEQVRRAVLPFAADVRIINLTGAKDFSEWIDQGHQVAELAVLVEAAAPPASEGGAVLLDAVAHHYSRFVQFPSKAALWAIALWTLHTHAIDAADTTPYIRIQSPEREAGKTRVIEVAATVVARPESWVNASPAAIFRLTDEEGPTLQCDEVNADKLKDKDNADLYALLNAGYRRGATVPRMVGEGAGMEVKRFKVFCAKALVGLGHLPDTIRSRCIVIHMNRRAATERIERFRIRKTEPEGFVLRDRLAAWTAAHMRALREAQPDVPDSLGDRAADIWEPLFSLADLAGGEWPQRAREAALSLSGKADAADETFGVQLLSDVRSIFDDQAIERIFTSELLAALKKMDESPWADYDGKSLGPHALGRLLRPYAIISEQIRVGAATKKGYVRKRFEDAWSRWLSPPPERAPNRNIETLDSRDDELPLEPATETNPATETTLAAPLDSKRPGSFDVSFQGLPGGGVAVTQLPSAPPNGAGAYVTNLRPAQRPAAPVETPAAKTPTGGGRPTKATAAQVTQLINAYAAVGADRTLLAGVIRRQCGPGKHFANLIPEDVTVLLEEPDTYALIQLHAAAPDSREGR